jgi:hypothetical protein
MTVPGVSRRCRVDLERGRAALQALPQPAVCRRPDQHSAVLQHEVEGNDLRSVGPAVCDAPDVLRCKQRQALLTRFSRTWEPTAAGPARGARHG